MRRVKLIAKNIKWIMLVSGVLTSTLLLAAIAPDSALRMIFGETLEGPLSDIIVRNWGVLVGLVGMLLIYGAFNEHVRKLVLVLATTSKVAFVGLILAFGSNYLSKVGTSIAIDTLFIVLFVVYLLGEMHTQDSA
jgi:hypothetical protein